MASFRKKYGVCHYTLRREILSVISESEYKDIAKQKLAQGNEPQRWKAGHFRGAAARKYKAVGVISIRTRHRKYGPPQKRRLVRTIKIPFIKIRDHGTREQCWMRLAVFNWIKANGPVPPGFYVASKNGNTMDCSLENLTLVNRETQILLNKQNFPGMDARGAATLHVLLRRHPDMLARSRRRYKNIPNDKYGPEVCIWMCSNCSADYAQDIMPETCDKCGHHSFEKSSYRRKTG